MKIFRKLVPFLIGLIVLSCSKDKVEDDLLRKSPPTAFESSAAPEDITTNSALISWSKSNDPEGKPITYTLLVDGVPTAENLNTLTYELDSLKANTEYTIEIKAYDRDRQSTSSEIAFTTKEEVEVDITEEPENSLFVEVDVDKITFNSVLVKWAAASAPTDKTVTYDIYLNDVQFSADMKESSFQFEALDQLTEYSVRVTAKSKDGKTSTETVVFTTLETPPNPSPFTIGVDEEAKYSATISWTDSMDPDEGAMLYDVYLNEIIIISNLSDTFYTFKELEDDLTYVVKIVAKTDKGGTHTVTQELTTTPAGEMLPAFEITAYDIDTQTATITWNHIVAQNGNTVTYDIYVNGEVVQMGFTDNQFELMGLNHNTAHNVRVVAKAKGHPSSENQTTFETLEAPSNFSVDSVILYNSYTASGDTFDPTIRIENITDSVDIVNIELKIGGRTYPVSYVSPEMTIIQISQADYDQIQADSDRTAHFTFTDNTDNLAKQYTIAFTFN